MRLFKSICILTILTFVGLHYFSLPALAQTSDQTAPPPAATPVPTPPASEPLKPAELDGLLRRSRFIPIRFSPTS
jgi:hypothetical protein